MGKISQLQDDSLEVLRAAAKAPRSFGEGMVNYMVRRREQLTLELSSTMYTFEVSRLAKQIRALSLILQRSGEKLPKKEWKRVPSVGLSGQAGVENALHLARVLTPANWEEKILPQFSKIADEALDSLIAEKDIEDNLALLSETQKWIRYLRNVEHGGETARAQLQRRVQNAR